MDGFNIVLIITIILFARLAVRLVTNYQKRNKNN